MSHTCCKVTLLNIVLLRMLHTWTLSVQYIYTPIYFLTVIKIKTFLCTAETLLHANAESALWWFGTWILLLSTPRPFMHSDSFPSTIRFQTWQIYYTSQWHELLLQTTSNKMMPALLSPANKAPPHKLFLKSNRRLHTMCGCKHSADGV